MCQGFSHFSGFLHHFVLAEVPTSSIRVKFDHFARIYVCMVLYMLCYHKHVYACVALEGLKEAKFKPFIIMYEILSKCINQCRKNKCMFDYYQLRNVCIESLHGVLYMNQSRLRYTLNTVE